MSDSAVAIEPFAVRVRDAEVLSGYKKSKIYELLNQGALDSYVENGCRFVIVESIKRHQRQQFARARGTPASKPSRRNPQKAKKT